MTLRSLLFGVIGLLAAAVCGPARAAWTEGFTEPFRRIDVAPAETGAISELVVHEGDRVSKGQLLATLDVDVLVVTREIALKSRDAHGKRDAAEAERDLRRTRLEKLEILRAGGHASQEEVERARTDLAVAEANLLTAGEQRVLDDLECKKIDAMIERRTIRSPIDGIVVKVHRDQREFVSLTNPAVFTIVELDPLRVIFSVPTADALRLHVGQTVPVLLADGEIHCQAAVECVAPLTDAESGTVRVKVLIKNNQGQYRAGVRCRLAVDGDAAPAAGRVSPSAQAAADSPLSNLGPATAR